MTCFTPIPDSGGGVSPTPPANCSPVDASAAVERILDAYGNGNATRQLLEELGNCCDPAQAQAILSELQSREPHNWIAIVSTSQLAALQGSDYSYAGLTALADAIAQGQAEGSISADDLYAIFGSGMSGFEQSHETGAQMLFGASNSDQMRQFETRIAGLAMDTLANADRNSASHGMDTMATGWASVVVSGLGVDSTSRQAVMQAYASPALDAGQRQHIRELLGDKDSVGDDTVQGENSLAVLVQSVAEAIPPAAADGTNLAVEMANWAGNNREFFAVNDFWGSRISQPRADALGLLLTTNADAVLNDLTDAYTNPQYAGDDSKRLGFLLSVTAFNPDNAYAASVTSVMQRYADGLVAQVGADPTSMRSQELLGRLEILSPALMIAQSAPYLGNLESNEARVDAIMQTIGVITTGASLVPIGRVANFLADMYGAVDTLTDAQISEGIAQYLTEAMSGSQEEREAALAEIATMVQASVGSRYADVPVVAGAMSRRVEDTMYDMLLAIANNDVGGYMETYSP